MAEEAYDVGARAAIEMRRKAAVAGGAVPGAASTVAFVRLVVGFVAEAVIEPLARVWHSSVYATA